MTVNKQHILTLTHKLHISIVITRLHFIYHEPVYHKQVIPLIVK
jgi:hypothetical protein